MNKKKKNYNITCVQTFKKWRCLDIAKLLYLNCKIITHRHDKFKCF